jgi:hypothetical protein
MVRTTSWVKVNTIGEARAAPAAVAVTVVERAAGTDA